MGWSDIPPCKNEGIPIEQYQQPRTVWLPAKAPPEAIAFYQEVLNKARETPEWKDYVERTAQTNKFLTNGDFQSFLSSDEARARQVFEKEGWLVR